MRKYRILCQSMDRPNEWVFLGGSYHSMTHAAKIYKDDNACKQLLLQFEDFKKLYNAVDTTDKRGRDENRFLEFQIMFQGECILQINNIREKAHLSEIFPDFVFVTEPSG